VNIHPDILHVIHKRVLLSGGFEANTQNLLQRGALLYCVVFSETGLLDLRYNTLTAGTASGASGTP
jgi:hypothetical protein